MSRFVVLAFVGAMAMPAAPAWGCACASSGGPPTVEDMVQVSRLIVVGRLATVGDPTTPANAGPRWIELVVEHVVKGTLPVGKIQVWDEMAGSSCGGRLALAQSGQRVVVALERVRNVAAEAREVWPLMGFTPPDDGLMLSREVCGVTIVPLTSSADERRWMRRRVR